MPELPEVETVRATLAKQIIDKQLINITFYYEKLLENTSPEIIKKQLIGQKITGLSRYGKYLIIIFEKDSIIVHLRMEGKFFIKEHHDQIEKHEHVVFTFSDETDLRFHDTRKFGKMALITSIKLTDIYNYPAIKKLGPEANVLIDEKLLMDKMQKSREHIKTFLLDQTNLAGLGNIYVDEICFMSHIHPERLANDISFNEVHLLAQASNQVLNEAIDMGGTTIRSYTSSLGVTGRFQQKLLVHNRENEPCSICHSIIRKIKVNGRGTYFCPTCQKQDLIVVGITGGIASGKSIVSNYLKNKYHYEVIDCDQIAHNLLEPTSKIYPIVIEKFTMYDIILPNGFIDRQKLGQIIFNDANAKKQLEMIVHPAVKDIVHHQISKKQTGIVFVDVPLLFETKMNRDCDYTIVVDCDYTVQLKRLINRDQISEEYGMKKIDNQMSLTKKTSLSDFVIDNSTTLQNTYDQVDRIIEIIKSYQRIR